jgi:hypothetical protein
VSRISDDSLIDVTYLNGNPAVDRRDRSQIAGMAIAANPDRRAFRKRATFLRFEPFVKLDCAAADICVGGACHFEGLSDL